MIKAKNNFKCNIICIFVIAFNILLLVYNNINYFKMEKLYAEKCNEYKELELNYNSLKETHYSLKECYTELCKEKIEVKENLLSLIAPLKEYDKASYLKQYKLLIEEYPLLFIRTNLYERFNREEIQLIQQCIETETYQSDIIGKINVACVILNRIDNESFPNNPVDVITAPNQFAYHRETISEETVLALEYAYLVGDTTNGCVSFRSDSAPTKWGNWNYQFTDEIGHNFYK